MWCVRGQSTNPLDKFSNVPSWSAVMVDTEEEAEAWWKTRTATVHPGRVSIMFNPQGEVVRVKFG